MRGLSAAVCGRRGKWVVLVIWLLVAAGAGVLGGRLEEVQRNDPASFLPSGAESTAVQNAQRASGAGDRVPAIVVYEGRPVAEAAADAERFAGVEGVAGRVSPPVPAPGGGAVQVVVPLDGSDYDVLTAAVDRIREITGDRAYVTGPAGQSADAIEVFGSIDATLLAATSAVVVLVLLVTYRSPLLWLIPFFSAGVALACSRAGNYLLAEYAGLTVSGQSGGILLVLVFGIATDYALLLVARYREELAVHEDRHEAMALALRRATPAIAASAATVAAGLCCLLVADQNATRGLGPVCAVGVACALAAMLTLLPALLVVFPRGVFWPKIPVYGGAAQTGSGLWDRVGRVIARRPRVVWIGTAAVLGAMALTLPLTAVGPLAEADAYRTAPESVRGAQVLERRFGTGQEGSLLVLAPSGEAGRIAAAVAADPGVERIGERAEEQGAGAGRPDGGEETGGERPDAAPESADGQVLLRGTLKDAPDSAAASATVERLREIPGARIGGTAAVDLDGRLSSERDLRVVVPLILGVVLVILVVLLRALVAPLLLMATVVLSFAAALGVSGLVFTELFGFAAVDTGVPLLAFVFLVAVGVDYNIFLITRIREEAAVRGTRRAALVGLSATGGVITSAGVVLAATFAVLGVLPLIVLAELGFVVAFGVLLDTFVVRSVLLTALTLDVGRWMWWPDRGLTRERGCAGGAVRGTVRSTSGP
ncbi:MMPL family transporter [Planomonospora sp. ID82291]|uniref:MMPL family transporter n=1 Tax=Planomonospora sp. ID82291 TaxID=2738136 RepID=UPI0018C43A8F|nr:MMPL family transporter [Planomonospora sp. ID82291]MBG0813079.1 MMPL family transporter [Planomonospora sp. ID82291]